MNNMRKLMETIPVPAGLEERVLEAAEEGALQTRSRSQRRRPVLRGAMAAACALALVLGMVSVRPAGPAPVETSAPADSGAALVCSFGLTAYAAGGEVQAAPVSGAGSALALTAGNGAAGEDIGHYTGCLFQITGEHIATISLSVDRGALYREKTRTGLTDDEVRAVFAGEERGEYVCTVYGMDEDSPMNADIMTPLESSVTEAYDSAVRYGFRVPPELYELEEDPEADMRQASWDSIDTFDGGTLTVSVTFTDGSEQSQAYRLHTGKLLVEYPEGGGRMTVLPELAEGEEPFLYGIYMTALEAPVQPAP